MSYDWEEIVKSKSDKELYEIYCGKSFLPESSIPFAETELKNRNLHFDNMDLTRDACKLESIEEEIDFVNMRIYEGLPYLTLKKSIYNATGGGLFAFLLLNLIKPI